jgi:hypothetical protein
MTTTLRATAEAIATNWFAKRMSKTPVNDMRELADAIEKALQAQVEACAKKVCAYCDMGLPHKDLEFHENKTAAGWRKLGAMPQFIKCDAAAIRAMKGSEP